MDFINFIKSKRYVTYNVLDKKPDIGTYAWSKVSFNDASKYHKNDSQNWGMRTGLQENGDYIIGLDFDMWHKQKGTNKYIQNQNTIKLFDEFLNLNEEKKGVFSSSTELNRGCIVDITKSNKIIEILSINGSSKIQKKEFCLEILNGFNMVLPPTKTKCKIRKQYIDKRTFLSNEYILKIEEGTDLEEFIYNYINDSTNKKKINKTDLRTKEIKTVFQKFNKDEYKFEEDKELFKPFLDLLNIERKENYNEWYKIGHSIKNIFGDDGYELFEYFSEIESENNKNLYLSWKSENYKLLNKSYIFSCCKYDNPIKFLEYLVNYDLKIEELQNKKLVKLFEKNVRKILEPTIWIKKNRKSNNWEYTTAEDIMHTYVDLKPFNKKFLNEYFNNNFEKDYYDFVDFIPTNEPIITNDNMKTFNMFKGFQIDKYEEYKEFILEENDPNLKWFKKHLDFLSNFDKNTLEFLLQWMAHIIHNTTNRPGISIVLQGIEGNGKTTLYEILKRIIGEKNSLMAERAEHTIFGRFNNQLENKILVNINEPDFQTFKGAFDQFKSLITDTNFTLEKKNQNQITISNYMSFLITTNNEILFNLSANDRRFYFIQTSPDSIKDRSHFEYFGDNLNDKKFIFAIASYLKKIYKPDFDFRKNQKENKTKFHKLLENNSKNIFYPFLQELVEDLDDLDGEEINEEQTLINIKPKELISKYKRYCVNNACRNYESGKSIKLKLLKINPHCHKKIKNISMYVLDINECILYLKNNKLYEN